MSYSILTGVVDNDPKGENGRGTIFYMEITESKRIGCDSYKTKQIARHEWGLLEQIAGKFKPEEIKAPFNEANRLEAEEASKAAKAEKQAG